MPPRMVLPPQFPERFATEWGRDNYGVFQTFAVNNVGQRLRWIPPGSFIMGSPENEFGRNDDEVQHEVSLSQGLWLGDTPVTQALWEAVMGTNPSHFKGPNHPVETVSWDDCHEFIVRLNEHVQGLDARLPTEAEWEYACRAGTTGATYAGDFHSGGYSVASVLEPIAWYRATAERTTHSVAQKQANPWGLYDMLGNVHEWCNDWFGVYDLTALKDPTGPLAGGKSVIRGSSWNSHGMRVRAAYRDANYRDYRFLRAGLRLARTPAPKSPRSRG